MPRHETLNTAIKSCTWVSEWKIQKGKNPPSVSVLYNHCPSIQHSPKEQFSLSVLKYSSLHPSMDKSQLRTDHMKVRNGDWGVTGSKKTILQKLLSLWKVGRSKAAWIQVETEALLPSSLLPLPCSHPLPLRWCSDHTQPVQSWSVWNSFVLGWIKVAAALGLILCQCTQKAGGGKVLVSGMGRGNQSRTMRALL